MRTAEITEDADYQDIAAFGRFTCWWLRRKPEAIYFPPWTHPRWSTAVSRM